MNFMRVWDLKLWVLVLHVVALSNPQLCCARHVRDYIAGFIPALQAITQYADRERLHQSVPEYIAQVRALQIEGHKAVADRVLSWWPWRKSYDPRNENTVEEAASQAQDSNGGGVPKLLPSSIFEATTKFPDWRGDCEMKIGVLGSRKNWQTYVFARNETRIARARAEAAAEANRSPRNSKGHDRFPSFPPLKNRCTLNAFADMGWNTSPEIDEVQVLSVNWCSEWGRDLFSHELPADHEAAACRQWSDPPPPQVAVVRGCSSFDVFVHIRALGVEVFGQGVYYSTTGEMHLVGCTQDLRILRGLGRAQRVSSRPELETARLVSSYAEKPPLDSNSSSSSEVCSVAVMLRYPPVNPRWNSQRVLKFALRSTSGREDPLYFDPLERNVLFPYSPGDFPILWQQRVETSGHLLRQLLGLVCVAKQILHGWNNEEALPFVSMTMLGIQIIHHLSQTTFFMDFRIGKYRGKMATRFDSAADFNYYGRLAWSRYVPYQGMVTVALFMYTFIFHKVGDRRRIMQQRVRRGRPGAKDPPQDGPLVYATIGIFCACVGLLGFPGYWDYTGSTTGVRVVSPRFWVALWEFVNNVMGMVVSLFLVPQMLGNWSWEVRGRPLSLWLYVGLPFLRSLPFAFTVAKYFQLVPIFAWYDPYLNSVHRFHESILVPWWEIGVIFCSALLVITVHFQFAAVPPLNPPSRHFTSESPSV